MRARRHYRHRDWPVTDPRSGWKLIGLTLDTWAAPHTDAADDLRRAPGIADALVYEFSGRVRYGPR